MQLTRMDRVALQLAPTWGISRLRARAVAETMVRHFEAAQNSRRTETWRRVGTDANAANAMALPHLRNLARDLVRNNGWAKRGKQVIANNTVGWGITPTPTLSGPRAAARARALWRRWAATTQCDVNGQRNIYGLQRLAINTIAESGEVLIRRYHRPLNEGLAIPLQLQILEPDHLDASRDSMRTADGGRIVQGVEFDAIGRRVAYWLLPTHPGASFAFNMWTATGASQRVPAEDVLHVYDIDRAGQARGYSWFSAAIVKLKEFDEFEDAQLLRQKIAACFAAFVTDADGTGLTLGDKSEVATSAGLPVETIEPGTVVTLPMGRTVTMAEPPQVAEGSFDERTLRAIAAGLGITYEDLTGDYSQVNFSSARMSRIAHWANVHNWQWNMLIPMLCDPTWTWAMQTAVRAGLIAEAPAATWTPQPMPMIDPDKEALAATRMVRSGMRTPDDVVREQGFDPDVFWPDYAQSQKRLDDLGIVLDTDARKRTQAGNPTDPRKSPPPKA